MNDMAQTTQETNAPANAPANLASTDAEQAAGQTIPASPWKNVDTEGQAFVAAKGWKTEADLLGSYRNLEKLMGAGPDNLLKIPKDGDKDGWNSLYSKLGRPEKVEDYGLTTPDGFNKNITGEAAKWFHEAGLSKYQASKIAEMWNQHMQGMQSTLVETQKAQALESQKALREEWGANFDKMDGIAGSAVTEFGMTAEQLSALQTAMGYGGAMKFLYSIGAKIGKEDAGLLNGKNPSGFALSPEQARARIDALRSDRTFSEKFISSDPQIRAAAREEMQKLHTQAFGQRASTM